MKAVAAALDLLPGWMWALVLAGFVALAGARELQIHSARQAVAEARADLADYKATAAEAARLAERSRRETEQRWAAAVQGVSNAGQQKIDVARADAERAGAAERRLQQRVSAFLAAIRGAAAHSGIAPAGTATRDPTLLLADLFGRARDRARLLGQFADDAHARGQTCEAYADAIK
ncbi:DUF2514 family protein [Variovorax sp. dw_954]|uniref:DUF2514 family protein n=1 Tax=Variovorax sp. dw_954 TaxID=2720078 RepID=UPI001BD21DD3|nr:DUF2514 family protein [Variovorax sp. dw_954]